MGGGVSLARGTSKLAKMPSDRDSDYATAVLERTEQKQPFVRPGQNDIKDIEERRCTDARLLARSALGSPRPASPGSRALNPAAVLPVGVGVGAGNGWVEEWGVGGSGPGWPQGAVRAAYCARLRCASS